MTVAYWCVFIVVFIPFIMAFYAKFRAGFTPKTITILVSF